MKQLLIAIILSSSFIACQSSSKTTSEVSQAERDLHDIWVLTFMEGIPIDSTTYPEEIARLELNPKDSSVMGTTGCNNLTGTMIADEQGSLLFGRIGTTKKYCMKVPESHFLDYLTQTRSYSREGLELTLYNDSMPVLKFKKVD